MLRCHQGESVAQVEAHLMPEDAGSASAGAVSFGYAVVADVAEKV